MSAHKNQDGYAHLLVLLVVFTAVGLVSSSMIPITRGYSDGKSNVAGVETENLEKTVGEIKVIPFNTPDNKKFKELKERFKVRAQEYAQRKDDAATRSGWLQDFKKNLEDLENEMDASPEGKMAFYRRNAAAILKDRLKVSSDSSKLVVETANGDKPINVFPDEAIKKMLSSGVMDYVDSDKTDGELASVKDVVKLEEKNGTLGYEVEGDRKHSILGLFTLKSRVKTFVSAENGEVVNTTQSLFGRILNRLAP